MATLTAPAPSARKAPAARAVPAGHEPVHNYLREPRPADDVADPYRRGSAASEQATGTITAMLGEIVPRLAAQAAPEQES